MNDGRASRPAQAMSAGPPARLAGLLVAACVLAIAVRLVLDCAQPLLADDIWWHVALGRVFLAERGLPAAEPLLFTAAGQAQYYQEWLFEGVVALVDRAGGLATLRALEALLVTAVLQQVYACGRREGFTPLLALVPAASLIFFAYQRLLQLRPELFAMLCFFALLNLYCVPRLTYRRVFGVVVVTALWSNLHATVPIVLPFLVAWLLGSGPKLALRSRAHLATLGAAVAAIAVNPQGARQYVFYFIHDANNPLARVVDEWGRIFVIPEGFGHVLPWSAPLLLAGYGAVLLAVLGLALATLRGKADVVPYRFAWAALALAAAAIAVRFLWLMPLAVSALLHAGGAGVQRHARAVALGALLLVVVHLYGSGTAGYAFPLRRDALAAWLEPGALHDKFLPAAVAAIDMSRFEGRLMAPYALGGYLSYALHPRVLVYFNGRYDSYPRAVYDDYPRMLEGGAEAAALVDGYAADAALLPADDVHYRLGYTLALLGWCEAYHDEQAVWLLSPTAHSGACALEAPVDVDRTIAARAADGDAAGALRTALMHRRFDAVLALLDDPAQTGLAARAAGSLAAMCALDARLAAGLPAAAATAASAPDVAAQRAAEATLCARYGAAPHGAGVPLNR